MTPRSRVLAVGLSVCVASCASTPMHFHTLVPAPSGGGPNAPVSPERIDLDPVRVPAQVDRAELVVRQRDGGINLLENEVWIAPLPDEIRSAVLVELIRQLAPMRGPDPAISVRLDVERFESAPARYALIEAVWRVQIKNPTREASLTCRSRESETVAPGFSALVHGHQRALVAIADQIAAASRELIVAGSAGCPAVQEDAN